MPEAVTLFLIYDVESGAVLQTTSSPWSTEQVLDAWQLPPGQAVLFVDHLPAFPFDQLRVVDGRLVERAAMTPTVSATHFAADGTAECVITNLPDPCVVTIAGAVTAGPVGITGGTFTLTSTQPGAITVSVRADPAYKPWETTIHAA